MINRIEIGLDLQEEKIFLILDGEDIDELFDPLEFVMPTTMYPLTLEFFTCSCGVAGCAGWHYGFDVTCDDQFVYWKNGDPENSKQIPAFLQFDRVAYIDAQYKATAAMFKIAAERATKEYPLDTDQYDEDFHDPDPILRFYSEEARRKAVLDRMDWHKRSHRVAR